MSEVWRAGDYEGVSDWADEDNGEGPILTIYYWLAGSFVRTDEEPLKFYLTDPSPKNHLLRGKPYLWVHRLMCAVGLHDFWVTGCIEDYPRIYRCPHCGKNVTKNYYE